MRAPDKPSAFGPNVLVMRHAYYLSILTLSQCVSVLINKILKTDKDAYNSGAHGDIQWHLQFCIDAK